jgi:GTPase SAR1 family protein
MIDSVSHISNKQKPDKKICANQFKYEFVNNPSIVMIGRRGCGKSWMTRSIMYELYNNNQIDEFIVIAPSDKMRNFYAEFLPTVHYEYKSEIIQEILQVQKKRFETYRSDQSKVKKVMVIFDDVFWQKGSLMKDSNLQELLFNNRQYKISYVLSMQFSIGIRPELRSNFDYIFLFMDDSISNIKRLYDHYTGTLAGTFDIFRQTFQNLTMNYGSMVIINRGNTKCYTDKIFQCKSKDIVDKYKLPSVKLEYDEEIKSSVKNDIRRLGENSTKDLTINSCNKKMDLLMKIVECNNVIATNIIVNNINNNFVCDILLKITESNNYIAKLLE